MIWILLSLAVLIALAVGLEIRYRRRLKQRGRFGASQIRWLARMRDRDQG